MIEGNGLDIVGSLRGGWDVNGRIRERGCLSGLGRYRVSIIKSISGSSS
jgi:hypothetical protein